MATLFATVQVDRYESEIGSPIIRTWTLAVSAIAFSKHEARAQVQEEAKTKAAQEFGTRLGCWHTKILYEQFSNR